VSAETFEYKAVVGVYEHAASLVKEGKTKGQVCEDLKSRGLNHDEASVVTDSIFKLHGKALKESGQLNMLYGALLCIGGVVVSAVTYKIAAGSSEGGRYVIAWGAVIAGAIQFLLGLAQRAGVGRSCGTKRCHPFGSEDRGGQSRETTWALFDDDVPRSFEVFMTRDLFFPCANAACKRDTKWTSSTLTS
jgi:hypothetical protein